MTAEPSTTCTYSPGRVLHVVLEGTSEALGHVAGVHVSCCKWQQD